MKYFEFGKENEELMVLLHGGGTSYLGVLPTAKKIAEKYHVVLLAYDGFNPSEPETEFQSLAYEAQGLEDYLIENYGGKVDILYGLSSGWLTIADWRIALSNIGGLIGTVFYAIAALSFKLAAPLLVAGIGFLLEMILPLPFNGFASGFESLGWIMMFLGGIRAIKNDEMEAYR